jgi:hypothetical protein
MGYSGARGTLIYEQNLKAKISCQIPFNRFTDKGSVEAPEQNLQHT